MISHRLIKSRLSAKLILRNGVSLVEVLFAMMIAVFGLAGVLAIFPLAARQAADSYSLNQATNGAISVASASTATKEIFPNETSPWVLDDDITGSSPTSGIDGYVPPFNNCSTSTYKPFKAFKDIYDGLVLKRAVELYGATPNAAQLNNARCQVLNQGFCYDPLYMSYVNQAYWTSLSPPKAWSNYATGGLIRRNRMPCYAEYIDPTGFNGDGTFKTVTDPMGTFTPRLIRVSSLQNPNFNFAAGFLPGPLSATNANARVSTFGDLIPASYQADKSFGALREFEGVNNRSLVAASNNSDLSWFATIAPMETRTLAPPSQFTVTIVVVKKRDRTFDVPDGSAVITTLPETERLALVTAMGSTPETNMGVPWLSPGMPYCTGSLLNTTLHFDSRSRATLRVGDYVMLSRNVALEIPGSTPPVAKYVHRHAWYRVAAVGEREDNDLTTSQISRDVVLQGRPWDYPDLNPALNNPSVAPMPPYYFIRTTATVVDNVVAVYEFPIVVGS